MRLKLTIEYAGTRYSGWQAQQNARTVQGELQKAIAEAMSTDRFELYGSGRTDAGVHALGQVAHLELGPQVPPETLRRRINDGLPADINVLRVEKASPRFHARHDAVARSYLYQVSRRRTAFAKPFVWWVKDALDLPRMEAAAKAYVGFHDFRAFSDDDPRAKSTTVHLESFDVHEDEDLLVLHIEASHFLWKMVRRMVGVLVRIGAGDVPVADAAKLLEADPSSIAPLTAPAAGLFLERVYYPGDRRDAPLQAAVRVAAAPDSGG
jgi:tRNA pseudouridine38-40 synthase